MTTPDTCPPVMSVTVRVGERISLYIDPSLDLSITARQDAVGRWLVRFKRRQHGRTSMDKTARWLPGIGWDRHCWHPNPERLNPRSRMALAMAESWLKANTSPSPA